MKRSDFHTKIAAAYKLAEDTGCWEVVKYKGDIETIAGTDFSHNMDRYEFALAVVEGKAVFSDDILYNETYPQGLSAKAINYLYNISGFKTWSWNPPKPKTVMVELLVEDVEFYAKQTAYVSLPVHISDAFRKALKEQTRIADLDAELEAELAKYKEHLS